MPHPAPSLACFPLGWQFVPTVLARTVSRACVLIDETRTGPWRTARASPSTPPDHTSDRASQSVIHPEWPTCERFTKPDQVHKLGVGVKGFVSSVPCVNRTRGCRLDSSTGTEPFSPTSLLVAELLAWGLKSHSMAETVLY